jgi:PAS domain S-box-containing protein
MGGVNDQSIAVGADVSVGLATTAEASDAAVICVAPDGTVVSWNAAAERLYGYSRAEIVGCHIGVLSPAERRDENERLRGALRLGQRIDAFDTVRLTRDGRRVAVRMTLSPLHDEAEQLVGFVGVTRLLARDPPAGDEPRTDLEAHLLGAAAALQERLAEGARLAGRLLMVQDAERRRIGRDLHDGVGQLLVALGLGLGRLDALCATAPEQIAECIADCRALVDQCVREVRSQSYLLHPPALDETGLASAVRWYLEGFARRSGIEADIVVSPDFPRLMPEVESALFRVLQECLSNVLRHSASTVVRVCLDRTASEVRMEVRDRGRGLSVQPPGTGSAANVGVGIPGMRERLRHLGGRLRIDSGAQGTRVQAILPWAAEAA